MKLYTKSGDDGQTARIDGRRVGKHDVCVAAPGAIDELNSHIGLCMAGIRGQDQASVGDALARVQAELMDVATLLAAAGTDCGVEVALDEDAVERIEREIDTICAALPEIETFILPGGCELASRLHVARCVCRRAERDVTAVVQAGIEVPGVAMKYLNRLGDLLFALSRLANSNTGREETFRGKRG